MTGYLRVRPRGRGAHVEVHQLVDDSRAAEFMEAACSLALGRLKTGVVAATKPRAKMQPRQRRPKNRRSA
jgi:hypothetical protein